MPPGLLFPEFKYVGFKSDLRDKTKIVELPLTIPLDDKEYYASIYRFEETVLKHGSLADLDSDIRFFADHLVFDFDSHESLDLPLQEAAHLCRALKAMGATYEVYFSGHKGFHVIVPTIHFRSEPTNDDGVLKRMATALCGRYRSWDPTIYNKTRILRLPNTVHAATGLYKVRLENIDELGPEDVLALAKEPYTGNGVPAMGDFENNQGIELLGRLYEQCKPKVNRNLQASDPKESFQDWGLIKDANEGKRNETLYKMARDLARHGLFERDALQVCHWWNRDLKVPLDGGEVDRTVRSAYKKGVNLLVSEENVFNFAFNSKRALAQVRLVYQNWAENVVRTGYSFLDEYTLGFFKGEVVFIISRPGNFKTCILSNILHGMGKSTGRPTIYFSMEMGVESLTARHIQKAEGLTQAQVLKGIREGMDFRAFEAAFQNVFVVDQSALNTDKVLQFIDKFLEEYGPLGAIGFDYLSLFEGCANDTARTARMATELKTRIAKAANCPVFCLVQAKREYEGQDGDVEIDKSAGKDSSSIEDSGDYIIGTWSKGWAKFLKSRKFLSEKYPENPYFHIDIDRERMDVKGMTYQPNPPRFRQKEKAGD